MKKLLLLILISPLLAFSQSDKELKAQIARIPKGIKQIVLSVDSLQSTNQIVVGLVKQLMDEGYELDKVDKELGLIQTKEKMIKFAWGARFTLLVADNKVKLKGKAILKMANDIAYDIENKGSLGDMYVYTFREMVRIANTIQSTGIKYEK